MQIVPRSSQSFRDHSPVRAVQALDTGRAMIDGVTAESETRNPDGPHGIGRVLPVSVAGSDRQATSDYSTERLLLPSRCDRRAQP